MAATENLAKKKLKIKIGSKGVRVEPEKDSDECGADVVARDGHRKLSMNVKVKLPLQGHSKKHGADSVMDAPRVKRQKIEWRMDRGVRQQCSVILEELMIHPCGWAFNEPVDPVAFNIPDYFTIISKPMDLGTVRSKLESNKYLSADEFAADVQLTFSNCTRYNPPGNKFHSAAKELNNLFNRKWKLLQTKLKLDGENVELVRVPNEYGDGARGMLQNPLGRSHPQVSAGKRRTMSLEEKRKLVSDVQEMLRGKMAEKLQTALRKYKLCSLKERVDVDINDIDDEILWELKMMLKTSMGLNAAKVEPAKRTESSVSSLSNGVVHKGADSGSRVSCGSANAKAKAPASIVDSRCGSCGHLTCQCSLRNGKSHPDSNVCSPHADAQLSPEKALRAAMLKSRFADTIFKARQETLRDQGDKAGPVQSPEERARLQKQQLQEKARLEAQIMASRRKAEADLKMQRERERVALQQMEKTVELYDNLKSYKDLEMLIKSSARDYHLGGLGVVIDVRSCGRVGNLLERLGLFLKKDFAGGEGEDRDNGILDGGDTDEGEIVA